LRVSDIHQHAGREREREREITWVHLECVYFVISPNIGIYDVFSSLLPHKKNSIMALWTFSEASKRMKMKRSWCIHNIQHLAFLLLCSFHSRTTREHYWGLCVMCATRWKKEGMKASKKKPIEKKVERGELCENGKKWRLWIGNYGCICFMNRF
jgi:hypothetical protein